MDIVTVRDVNDHLSSPPWDPAQERACQELIDKRTAELRRWFGVPIDPIPMAETVRVHDSGVLLTSLPVYKVLTLAGVDVVGGRSGCALPSPYYWLDEHWITSPKPALSYGYTTRPFDLVAGAPPLIMVTLAYLGGWGPCSDITGAIITKVAATMMNRHDDTVTTRALDDKTPPQLKEEWTDAEYKALRSRKRPAGARS
jgi:hypothetical protein